MASFLRQLVAGPRSRHPEAGLDLCYVTDQIVAMSGPSSTYPKRAYRNPLDEIVKFFDAKHQDNWAIWEFRAEGTGYPDEEVYGRVWHYPWPDHHPPPFRLVPNAMASMRNWLHEDGKERKERVVVVHCKAGKGRSGTMISSYLIAECGWKTSEALARFTERRMRPGFGPGVSIPSQLRWVGYVHRWTHSGKIYVDRPIEILEIHIWGLRDGVKVAVEGFVDEGKSIKVFHVFAKNERFVVEGNTPGGNGLTDMLSDMAAGLQKEEGTSKPTPNSMGTDGTGEGRIRENQHKAATMPPVGKMSNNEKEATGSESGGSAVVFKAAAPVILPTSDVNIDFERRNKAGYGWTMVTAVAHVWFNAFFEGHGPEKQGRPDDSGVFEIAWDQMDGIKGSSRKGTRALDRLAVVWRAVTEGTRARSPDIIREPGEHERVEQARPADWRGSKHAPPDARKDLGLRQESPGSADISKANSVRSIPTDEHDQADATSVEGVKPSGPDGMDADAPKPPSPVPGAEGGLETASAPTSTTRPAAHPAVGNDHSSGGITAGVSSMSTAEVPSPRANGSDGPGPEDDGGHMSALRRGIAQDNAWGKQGGRGETRP